MIARRRRAARKAEAYILSYAFPTHIEPRVRRRAPQIDAAGWPVVEQGLREWFVCCAWRGRTMLGMPSRLVDEAWHEFILDSLSYVRFCDVAFGEYLHHTPDEAMSTPMPDALGETVRAWDRSDLGSREESVLWDLDGRFAIEEPLGVTDVHLIAARSRAPYPPAGGWACGAGATIGGGAAEGGGHHPGAHSSGCAADGGGGGGCGGGGCGGGS